MSPAYLVTLVLSLGLQASVTCQVEQRPDYIHYESVSIAIASNTAAPVFYQQTSYITVTMVTARNICNSSVQAPTAKSVSTLVTSTPLVIISVVIGVVALLGTVGNLVSMYVYYPRGKQGNVYVFFLSCIDLVMASVVMPLTCVVLAGLMNIVQLYLFAVALVFIVLQSIFILISISVDRYIACCHPQYYNNTQRYAKIIIPLEVIFNFLVIGTAFIKSILFTVLSRVIIAGGFVLIVALYIRIFLVLRRRVLNLGPEQTSTGTSSSTRQSTKVKDDCHTISKQSQSNSEREMEGKMAAVPMHADEASQQLPEGSVERELVADDRPSVASVCDRPSRVLSVTDRSMSRVAVPLSYAIFWAGSAAKHRSATSQHQADATGEASGPWCRPLTPEVSTLLQCPPTLRIAEEVSTVWCGPPTPGEEVSTVWCGPPTLGEEVSTVWCGPATHDTADTMACSGPPKHPTDVYTISSGSSRARDVDVEQEHAIITIKPSVSVTGDRQVRQVSMTGEAKQPASYTQPHYQHSTRKKLVTRSRLSDTRTKNLTITIKTFVSVTVVFVAAFLPSYLIQYGFLPPIPHNYAFTYYLNHIANPIIYFSLNRTYRQKTKRLLHSIAPCYPYTRPLTS